MTPKITIDPDVVERRVMELARIGACAETGVCRTVYSPEWVAAQDMVAGWFTGAGLTTRRDAVGNVWGRVEGTAGGQAVVSGSHIDTQLPGGRYDGALGIIAALTAIEALVAQFGPPKRPVEALSFCEEEGSRYGGASFWGSRAITGDPMTDDLTRLVDVDGMSIADAMRAVGLDPARIPEAKREDIGDFIELHVEQGPILEHAEIPVGIVNVINGARGYRVTVVGDSNHAGAMPMDLRRDPLVGAAEMIIAVQQNAVRLGRPAVATVGFMRVEPGWPAIIPKTVTFSVNTRHNNLDALNGLAAAHENALREIAHRRGLQVSWVGGDGLDPCPSDPTIVAMLEASARDQGIAALTMPSGALHDAQRMAGIARMAMVFVQSKDGRSHTPEEFSSIEHCVAGIRVLAGGLHALAW
jgi:allantoate deiminase